MTLTVTGDDAVLLLCLGLLILSGWWLIVKGFNVAEMPVYALLAAGALQLGLHPGVLSRATVGLLLAGLVLALTSLTLDDLTDRQLSKLRAAGRYSAVNWRELVALSLWVAGAVCAMTAIHPVLGVGLIAGVATWVWWVLRPAARVIRSHVSIEIRCDPERAFAIVGDPRQESLYIDDIEIDAPADQAVGIGYRYVWRLGRKEGYVFEDEEEVIEYQRGHRIKTRSRRHPWTFGTVTVELAPGGTRVIQDFEGVLTIPQAALGLRNKAIIRLTEMRQRWWGRLKELLEAGAA